MNKKYTKELLEPIVKESFSVAEVCRKLGITDQTGNITHIKKRIEEFEIDKSHFTGMLWSKGKTLSPKRTMEDYLSNTVSVKSSYLLRRLIKENYKDEKCEKCKSTTWLNQPIPLELHHINCNHNDNSIDNLQILCPTCHAFIHKYEINKHN